MWVTVAPTARALPHEIDNRNSWLEGLDPDKDPIFKFFKFVFNFFYFAPILSRGFLSLWI